MKKAIIGKKVGMTQIFDETGKVVPVTVIEAGPCKVVQKKSAEKEGYASVQLGFEEIPERKLNKPEKGHLDKAGVGALRVLHEFRLENANEMNVGDVVKADAFKEGDKVDVTGISKGKGYAGVIKRWGAQRTPMTHGGGPVHRHAGSMGSSTDPSRILPGKIGVKVDPELNMIVIRGAIPGPKGGIVFIKNTAKTLIVKQASVSTSVNPQKASARTNPQKASARNR